MTTPVRVFISYAHESAEQRERVAKLAKQLREEGVDAWIDQFVEDDPPYWPTWTREQIEQADFVLCVVSATYRERFEARERLSTGRGVSWEAAAVTEASYADLPDAHRKFIAVAFDARDLTEVPKVLLGAGRTGYLLFDYYHQLYRRITGQARGAPPLGSMRVLPSSEALRVESRPPFVTARFVDRERETRQLRDAVLSRDAGCVLVTGRTGSGKTALIARLLQFLETREQALTFAYVSAAGSAPLSADLLRAHVRTAGDAILVVDQAETLLDAAGAWRSAAVGAVLAELAARPSTHVVIVSRRTPCAAALNALSPLRITLGNGLPPEHARQLLLDADAEGALGLRDAPEALDSLVAQADGNPRALELIVGALAADPLLEPGPFADALASDADFAEQLLGGAYDALDGFAREIVGLLGVAHGVMPVDVLRAAVAEPDGFVERMRELAGSEIVRYDRVARRVRLDPFDARYVTRHVVAPEELAGLHRRIAVAAAGALEDATLVGSEADTWAIAVVDHFLAAGAPADAALALDRFQAGFLEQRGIYDQLVRLRRDLLERPGEPLSNRVSLLRLLTLQGDFRGAHELIERSDAAVRADAALAAAWDVEVGTVERDCGKPEAARARLRRTADGAASPSVRARALTAAAQIARRAGDLDTCEAWLDEALALVGAPAFADRQTEALALHQRALVARFRRRQAEALAFLTRSVAVSEAAEDFGGLAYRQSLRAALDSDNFALDDARTALELALATYDEIGDVWGTAAATAALASIESDRGCYDTALTLAERAAELARASSNLRVLGLLPAVRLHVERRRSAVRAESRALVVRAQRSLTDAGYALYAQRLAIDLLLHDVVTGAVGAAEALAALPSGLLASERAEAGDGEADTVLLLARPLAVFAPIASLPDGIAADVELALSRA